MNPRFQPAVALPAGAPDGPAAGARWLAFRGADLVLVPDGAGGLALPASPDAPGLLGADPAAAHYLGVLDGAPAWAVALAPDAPLPPGAAAHGLRGAHALVDAATWTAAGYASQILYWDRTTRYCGECGVATAPRAGERARACPRCGHLWYPRVSPCMIALVHDGARILMTRQAAWPPGRYGLVAGFVEPQESLEDCVRREILEETSVEVADVAYAGSQAWPFPHQLMVGFYARYVRGEVAPRDGELEDARWFAVDALPLLPPPFSIARALIDRYVADGPSPRTDR